MSRPSRYRWDVYGNRKTPGPWYSATTGKLKRAIRALRLPQERIRVELSDGSQLVLRPKGLR